VSFVFITVVKYLAYYTMEDKEKQEKKKEKARQRKRNPRGTGQGPVLRHWQMFTTTTVSLVSTITSLVAVVYDVPYSSNERYWFKMGWWDRLLAAHSWE
jgi:hypothetical protein